MSDNKEILVDSQSENVDMELQPKTRIEYFLNKIAEGKGGGGGSGVNILTLYAELLYSDDSVFTYKAYKNAERTIEFSGYQEAVQALEFADIIKVLPLEPEGYGPPLFATLTSAHYIGPENYNVNVSVILEHGVMSVILINAEPGEEK